MNKKMAFICVIAIALLYNAYHYVNNRVLNPFMIDASSGITGSGAADWVHTTQTYSFRLVNTSDKAVKLIDVELQGYHGIKPGKLTVAGEPLTAREFKSNRAYSSAGNWSTSEGLTIEYQAEILEPQIQNPSHVMITFSYFGMKHTQEVMLPGIQSPSSSSSTIVTSQNVNFNVPVLSMVIMVFLLYTRRELDEKLLGLKLFGYSWLGAFYLNFTLLIPLGIFVCLLFYRPQTNAKIKMYAALIGFTLMMLSHVSQNI